MSIKKISDFPVASGVNLTPDDLFLIMDDPSGAGVTKKVSLATLSSVLGSGGGVGGGGSNVFDQSLNTTDFPTFSGVNLPNGTSVAPGSFDTHVGGNGGISLNCAVGYELNWQAGHLKNTSDNGQITQPLYIDSEIRLPNLLIGSSPTSYYSPNGSVAPSVVRSYGQSISLVSMNGIGPGLVHQLNWNNGHVTHYVGQEPPPSTTIMSTGTIQPLYFDSPISFSPAVSSLDSNTSTVTDASIAEIFDIVLTNNIILENPINPVNGKTLRWRISQDSTGNRQVTLGNKFNLPGSASPLAWSTAPNKMDVLAATYHSGRDKWDIVAFVPGY